MDLTSRIRNADSPHFYFILGELISSTDQDHFALNMLKLIDKLLPVTALTLCEWTLDKSNTHLTDIKPLGNAGAPADIPALNASRPAHNPQLLKEVLEMEGSLLIRVNARTKGARRAAHQCTLVSRDGSRRCVVTLYRSHTQKDFSLSELSLLKNLSEALLPLIESYAQFSRQSTLRKMGSWMATLVTNQEPTHIHREFEKRLALCDITLSTREQEVCLGLLNGRTVPEIAETLQLKNSSIETYLKRATAKLGVSGRHGLTKWMVGA
ncbi:helix-turn-helix transcriptional regulator [Pseudomonas poae]|uniref:Helix-turn-helix transcriptional regulator n=1 Tax=Pseudomonas poae TaxID=200451 RepID=A0A423F7S2_9PSED|nr:MULTISPECIES: helix-turn-helix transcriptional regulator [Pseudomonas]ROM52168.1 helix-turn-helix transcriptional regulator [Pseudomonas poae]TFF02892.1 LuxR family transcriptional regulator [Pseudomonas sp. JMN1]TFF04339.1 LuxR family transcriptional regulator [Pseudomonas sp. BCA17]TFF20131.1 LuxR family transcriptional regulator [Pseudomonas sp. BCA14]TFF20390.1 LuxR family transcriptional regulator [Pseudomonas sp. BCA13]